MSESNEHRFLVEEIANGASLRYPKLRIIRDIINRPGDERPPTINGSVPDVYATDKKHHFYLIGEAKTDSDLDLPHTYEQIEAFATFLENKERSIIILGAIGKTSDRAKTILYFLKQEMSLQTTILQVYDGLDFWELGGSRGTKWHLI